MVFPVVLVGLMLAGLAGAAIMYTVREIKPGGWVERKGLPLLCQNAQQRGGGRAFFCSLYTGKVATSRSYGVVPSGSGVVVVRWSKSGKSYAVVASHANTRKGG